jgi:hypothetical protein
VDEGGDEGDRDKSDSDADEDEDEDRGGSDEERRASRDTEASHYGSDADRMSYTNDSYIRFEINFFELDMITVGIGEGSAGVGTITSGSKRESIFSLDVGAGVSGSAFTVEGREFGLGVGLGAEVHGPWGGGLGMRGEVFGLGGAEGGAGGVILTKTVGYETTGRGVEVRAGFGGAFIRGVGEVERQIKAAMGYWEMCPQCP